MTKRKERMSLASHPSPTQFPNSFYWFGSLGRAVWACRVATALPSLAIHLASSSCPAEAVLVPAIDSWTLYGFSYPEPNTVLWPALGT